jgi:hypothetical protein
MLTYPLGGSPEQLVKPLLVMQCYCFCRESHFGTAAASAALCAFFRWLLQQPAFYNMQLLLRELPTPSLMDVRMAALPSPLLRLRVVQLKLWKVRPCCDSLGTEWVPSSCCGVCLLDLWIWVCCLLRCSGQTPMVYPHS